MVTTMVLPGIVPLLTTIVTPTMAVAMVVTCPLKADPLRLVHSSSLRPELGLLPGAP
jgi:hypothetical protein